MYGQIGHLATTARADPTGSGDSGQQHPRGDLGARPPDAPWRIGRHNCELWTRYVVTAVSQVTVAVYVFIWSWNQGNDKEAIAGSNPVIFRGGHQMLGEAMGSQER
ncbi:hypothetical protein PR202_ga16633 [Eleusine coracana subsp. coracana]|uniref:Uncharacterized protein n=1 Tax=Eleusine coracana subsp. coracana TaxID=191504 RepID=A0AAV5CNC5_ELECO|nr:hypothetical protein PR202_ga16633 [Eleusine coracana subsp. coracana]